MAYGKLNRNFSGQLEYEVERLELEHFDIVRKLLAEQLALTEVGKKLICLDEILSEYKRDNLHVGIEWDIWSGLCIRALHPESEALVKEIGEAIEEIPSFAACSHRKP